MKPMSEASREPLSSVPLSQSPLEPVRRIAWPVDPSDPDVNAAREWLVYERAWRLCLRHRAGRDHAPLSRPAQRGAAGAARPDRDAEPRRRAVAVAGWTPRRARQPGALRAHSGHAGRTASSPNSVSRPACQCGDTTSKASCSRNGSFLTHMQNTVHVIYELVAGADRVELALRPSVNFRAQESPVSVPLCWPYEFRAVEDRCEISCPNSGMPPLRLLVCAGRCHLHVEG